MSEKLTKEKRFQYVIEWFETNMPVAETELHYQNPYQLIVAVILSAQCTDKRVNMITPRFFKVYPDAESLSDATAEQVFEVIKSCSYPNNKAKHLVGMANMLIKDFNGIVPNNLELLQKLPGVGRKTANVILSVAFDKPAMAVDTHVHRVSARIGLTYRAKTPLETEKQLVKFIPENKLAIAHHWLILHGRYVCNARKPDCLSCGLKTWCRYYSEKLKSK